MIEATGIKLSKKLYNKDSILAVLRLFSDIAESTMAEDERYHIIKLAPKTRQHEAKSLAGEFANQCLIASKNQQNEQ